MKNFGTKYVVLFFGAFWVMGCAAVDDGNATQTSSTADSEIAADQDEPRAPKSIRRSERQLGPDERRNYVFVVPGDALVEVDGQRVERRDGVIEIVGKIGEVHRLRAWKGDKTTETKELRIAEEAASPSYFDVNEVKPATKQGKSKPAAAKFDLKE